MKHLFLTGGIQVGKSTAIRRFLETRPELSTGGFRTVAGPGGAEGDGIYLIPAAGDASLTERNLVFLRGRTGGTRRFAVRTEVFDAVGVALLDSADGCGLILMDEIGTREKDALRFQQAILRRLDGAQPPVLGVVQSRPGIFLDTVRSHPNVELWTVTPENREEIFQKLRRRYQSI